MLILIDFIKYFVIKGKLKRTNVFVLKNLNHNYDIALMFINHVYLILAFDWFKIEVLFI